MKTALKWLLFTLAAFALFLLVQLPARLLVETWPPPAPWRLQQLGGSVWDAEIGSLQFRHHDLGRMHWQLSPWHLLLGELSADWQLQGPHGRSEGSYTQGLDGGGGGFHAVELDLAASLLSDLGWSPLSLGGRVQGRLERLVMNPDTGLNISGRLQWREASLAGGSIDLGQVSLRAGGDGGADSLLIDNSGGDLQLEGVVAVEAGQRIALRLQLQPRNARGEQAVRLLLAAGGSGRDGGVEFRYNGSLPSG